MPDYLLIDEEQKMFYTQRKWSSKEDTDYLKACEDLRAAHNYEAMPIHHRFKVWDVDYSEKDAEKIINCVKQAREYLNELLVEHSQRLINNLQLMVCSHEVNATIVELG